jgi:glycosyltransferase involved in cell wall biosynthesis
MPEAGHRPSVVIAAHNEEQVLGRCLESLTAGTHATELEIVVAANGCSDNTAAVARSFPGVTVVELPRPGKAAALNAAEGVATGFPRIYLDADMCLTSDQVESLCDALAIRAEGPDRRSLSTPPPLVAYPRRRMDLRGRPLLVRAYYAINQRLPAFTRGAFGRGVMCVSATGRRRFDVFPDVIADDLFLDSVFDGVEKRQVSEVEVLVQAPLRTRDLLRRLERVRRGNRLLRQELEHRTTVSVPPARTLSWLTDVALRRPWLLPAAGVYVALTAVAELRSRRGTSQGWGRDDSTRSPTLPALPHTTSHTTATDPARR